LPKCHWPTYPSAHGIEALAKVVEFQPDVLTLDVQMPRLDGLGVLRELRRRGSRTKAIMVSSLTAAGAPTTVEALLEGAFDVVPQPVGVDGPASNPIRGRTGTPLGRPRGVPVRPRIGLEAGPSTPSRSARPPVDRRLCGA